jgi:hypothetical protein
MAFTANPVVDSLGASSLANVAKMADLPAPVNPRQSSEYSGRPGCLLPHILLQHLERRILKTAQANAQLPHRDDDMPLNCAA